MAGRSDSEPLTDIDTLKHGWPQTCRTKSRAPQLPRCSPHLLAAIKPAGIATTAVDRLPAAG
jgi:hypothetical protein